MDDYAATLHVLDAMMGRAQDGLSFRSVSWASEKGMGASGAHIVHWLISHRFADDSADAVSLATHLVREGGLVPAYTVTNAANCFENSAQRQYIHRGRSADVLNRLTLAGYPGAARPCFEVLQDIGVAFAGVMRATVVRGGHEVRYEDVRGCAHWKTILVLLAELAVSGDAALATVSDELKKACFFNLYNTLIFAAKLCFGHPNSISSRGKFFNNAAFMISGRRLSSVELEHGILRKKMPDSDPRVGLRLLLKDSRMHFVLNCGARSCPPLVVADPDRIERQLRELTTRFIETNCIVDQNRGVVVCSRLFKWFRGDFTPGSSSDEDLVDWLCTNGPDDFGRKLMKMTRHREHGGNLKPVKIKFALYDWADNGDPSAPPDTKLMSLYDISFQKEA